MIYFIHRELKDNLNIFLKQNAFWLSIGIVALIILVILIIILINKKNFKKNKIDALPDNDEFIKALGNIDNINEASANGSRLNIKLKDLNAINRDELTRLGVSSLITMSNKITLVIEGKAEKIANNINKALNR